MGFGSALLKLFQRPDDETRNARKNNREALARLEAECNMAKRLMNEDDHVQAAVLLKEVRGLREGILGPDAKETLEAAFLLGYAHIRMGELPEGEAILKDTLERQDRTLGKKNPVTHQTADQLVMAYTVMGRYPEAENILQRRIPKDKQPNLKDPLNLRALMTLGGVYKHQKKFAEAEAAYLKCVEGMIDVHGGRHPTTLDAIFLFGTFYLEQKDLDNAERIFLLIWDIGRENLSPMLMHGVLRCLGEAFLTRIHASRLKQTNTADVIDVAVSTRMQKLVEFIAQLCSAGLDISFAPMETLGRSLLFIDKDSDAQMAFGFRYLNPLQCAVIPAACDGCRTHLDFTAMRHVCKACLDIDLCAACFESYQRGDDIITHRESDCKGHPFLTVVPLERTTDAKITADERQLARAWLDTINPRAHDTQTANAN